MFNANYLSRQVLAAIAENSLPDVLQAVATERGLRVKNPRAVYQEVIGTESRQNVNFPNVEVRQPEGVSEASNAHVGSEVTVWVLATVTSDSMSGLDQQAQAYLTALGRAYTYGEGRSGSTPYTYELTGFSTSPPFEASGSKLQTVGVSVLVTVVESV